MASESAPLSPLDAFLNVLKMFRSMNELGDAAQCLSLLKVYLQNIVKTPSDPKFRKILTTNPNYQWKIGAAKHSSELVLSCGFDLSSPTSFDYPNPDVGLLKTILDIIIKEEKEIAKEIAAVAKLPCLGEPKLSRAVIEQCGSTRFAVGFYDNIGRRKTMEDEIVVLGMGPRQLATEDYYAIFDGHSGTEASVLAAKNLHVKLDKNLRLKTPNTTMETVITDSFKETDAMMVQKNMRCGTCALVTFVTDHTIYVANLGDSRAVLGLKGNRVRRITTDHKPDLPSERARIEQLGGNVQDIGGINRVLGDISVCRSLGDIQLKPFVTEIPEIFTIPLPRPPRRRSSVGAATAGPRSPLSPRGHHHHSHPNHHKGDMDSCFIVMACDGVWDVIPDEDAVDVVYKTKDPLSAAKHLTNEALKRGSTDNLSVIVIFLIPRDDWDDPTEDDLKKRAMLKAREKEAKEAAAELESPRRAKKPPLSARTRPNAYAIKEEDEEGVEPES